MDPRTSSGTPSAARLNIQYYAPSDPGAFDEHYESVHAGLVAPTPGLRRFTRSHPRSLGRDAGEAPYFVAELWFDDLDALKAGLGSEPMAAATADLANLVVARTVMFTAEVMG